MNISNVSSYGANQYALVAKNNVISKQANNSISQQLKEVVSNNNTKATSKDNDGLQAINDAFKNRLKNLKTDLSLNQAAESQTQEAMTYLQEKDQTISTVKAVGEELKDLSAKYKNEGTSAEDKLKIEKEAENLLKGIGNLMNKSNNSAGSNVLAMQDTDGSISILASKEFNVSLNYGQIDEHVQKDIDANAFKSGNHFENKLNTKDLLNNSSIIDERISKPAQKALEAVVKEKSFVYSNFADDSADANNNIDNLFKSGAISEYRMTMLKTSEQMLSSSMSSMACQSSNINKDNVSALLR